MADIEQKTRQQAKETSGDSELLCREVVKDRRAVDRYSSALTRYASLHKDRWDDAHATSMSNSVLSSNAIGSNTVNDPISCKLGMSREGRLRTSQEAIVLQVRGQHSGECLYVVPHSEPSV